MLTPTGAGATRLMPPGTVFVLTRGMTLFRDLPVVLNMQTAAFNQDVKALTPSADLDAEFLAAILTQRKSELLQHVSTAGHGTGRLDTQRLELFPVPVPPLSEQRKIAEILRTWDDAIELIEAHVSRLQTRRGWIRMEVLTGHVCMGDHPGSWSRTPLHGVLREHKQRSSGSEEVFSVSVHKGLVNQKEHLGRSFAAANTDHYNLVNPGDIVYTKSPTGDFPLGIIKRSAAPYAVLVSPLYGVFTPQNPNLGVMLDAYFESPRTVQNYISPLAQKGAKNTISITNQGFLSGHLNLPVDAEEQRDLATLLAASREEIAAAQRKAELLRIQKRGLMQKLLTGQVRVNVASETERTGQDNE
jgi:type I restriction enzyme S subunit